MVRRTTTAAGLPQILQYTRLPDGGSPSTTTYVYGLGLIATTSGANVTSYYLGDGLGSTAQLASTTGAVTDSYTYDVFGAPRTVTGTTGNDFRFTGQQDDRSANRRLYYLRARHYDPALGRFLGKDPLPMQQRYAYSGNNPINFADPTGMCHGAQLYAHPLDATPVPNPPKDGGHSPNACSTVSEFPAMTPSFVLDDLWDFLTTNQCVRGVTRLAAAGVVLYLAVSTGGPTHPGGQRRARPVCGARGLRSGRARFDALNTR